MTDWRGGGHRRPPGPSNFPAVVGPVQQRLALALAAGEIARFAMPLDLADMPADGFPALDLACVLLGLAAAQIIAAIPLEPAARIVRMDPTLLAPFRQRLAGTDTEISSARSRVCRRQAWRARTRSAEIPFRSRSCISRKRRRGAASPPASVRAGSRGQNCGPPAPTGHSDSRAAY